MPPTGVASILPVASPLHSTSTEVSDSSKSVGSVNVTDRDITQLLASVTMTVYVPATRLLLSSVVMPSFHANAYGVTPPMTVRSMLPVASLLQAIFIDCSESSSKGGSVIVMDSEITHPLLSVIVTPYKPTGMFVLSSDTTPSLHENE